MLSKITKIASVMIMCVMPLAALADHDDLNELQDNANTKDWVVVKNDTARNIKTFDKREQDKRMRSFKIDAVIDAPVETVARVYFDIENYPRWFWQVLDRKVVKKVSETEFYYYLQHRAPVGLPVRDVVIHAVVEPYNSTKHPYVLFKLKAVPDYLPRNPSMVRMEACDMVIKWTPLGEQTREEVEGYIDPSGGIPSWANTAVQRLAPYWTMVALQRVVKLPEYQKPVTPMPFRIFDNG